MDKRIPSAHHALTSARQAQLQGPPSWALLPPASPDRKAIHSLPPAPPEENSCSRPRGSEAGNWGGDKEGLRPHWAGSQFLGHVSRAPHHAPQICAIKRLQLALGDPQGSGRDLAIPENEAKLLFPALLSKGAATSRRSQGAGSRDFQLFSLGSSWVLTQPARSSTLQSGVTFLIAWAVLSKCRPQGP